MCAAPDAAILVIRLSKSTVFHLTLMPVLLVNSASIDFGSTGIGTVTSIVSPLVFSVAVGAAVPEQAVALMLSAPTVAMIAAVRKSFRVIMCECLSSLS